MSTETMRPLKFAGVLYTPETKTKSSLNQFARTLKKRGFNVHGIVQEKVPFGQSPKPGVDAVDLKTGDHTPLLRPTKENLANGTCGLDVSQLTACTAILENSLKDNADILVVEKFGDQEQKGEGLMDEVLAAALSGIPTLMSVPANAVDKWQEITGGLGDVILMNEESYWKWWSPKMAMADLAAGIDELDVIHLEFGQNALMLSTLKGAGVVANRWGTTADADFINSLEGKNLKELAAFINEPQDILKFHIGLCAILSFYNGYDVTGSEESGLNVFDGSPDDILVVGPFPKDKFDLENVEFVDLDNALTAAYQKSYEGCILPAAMIAEQKLAPFLMNSPLSTNVLVGPETPLAPNLYSYGLNILSGRVIEDADKACEMVKAGAKPKDLKSISRYVTIKSDD